MKDKFEFEKVSIRLVKEPPIMSPIPITSPEEAIDLVGKEIRESSEEVGEDSTKYGEFISSYFAWVSLPKQKEKVEELENITKKKDKKR